MSRGYRRMRGEDRGVADVLEGLLGPEPVPVDQVGGTREEQECAVAFVHVKDVGVDVELGEELVATDA